MKKPDRNSISGFFIVIGLVLALYLYNPITLQEISTVQGFAGYVRSFGPVMPVTSFVLSAIQAVFPVIPFVILCSANGVLFGMAAGIGITWAGSLAGASVAFFAARKLGYRWAAQRYSNRLYQYVDRLNGSRGFLVILTLRLLPYFPAPLINISAGVSKVRYFWFLTASALGKLPFIVGYSFLGYSLLQGKNYTLGAAVMAGLIFIPYLLAKRSRSKIGFRSEKS